MAYEFIVMNSKEHNLDFCYEFIHETNIYEFTNLISWEILGFCIKLTQQQLKPINLNTCKAM